MVGNFTSLRLLILSIAGGTIDSDPATAHCPDTTAFCWDRFNRSEALWKDSFKLRVTCGLRRTKTDGQAVVNLMERAKALMKGESGL